MGLGELLDQVRTLYVDQLLEAGQKQVVKKGTQLIFEPVLCGEHGQAISEGILQLPLRKDIAVLKAGAVSQLLTVDTNKMIGFETINFDWSSGLQVQLMPFQWQALLFRIPTRKNANWSPLQDWYWRWFRQDEDGADGHLLGVVHFLSDPRQTKRTTAFEVDMGSAPVEAFEELLDAVAALNVPKCEIGVAPKS